MIYWIYSTVMVIMLSKYLNGSNLLKFYNTIGKRDLILRHTQIGKSAETVWHKHLDPHCRPQERRWTTMSIPTRTSRATQWTRRWKLLFRLGWRSFVQTKPNSQVKRWRTSTDRLIFFWTTKKWLCWFTIPIFFKKDCFLRFPNFMQHNA